VIYAIVPARSGSRGLPHKNVRPVAGKELIGYSIEFAKSLPVDRVFCSTDSDHYATIARSFGAEVPFLRSPAAAQDASMEEDILDDLYSSFDAHGIQPPTLFVWLRPTFPFRDRHAVCTCIERMTANPGLSACRVVIEADPRLYKDDDGFLVPTFPANGRSMIRRQEFCPHFRVFNTDVFRGIPRNAGPAFLGSRVQYIVAPKICGVDIDDDWDLQLASALIEYAPHLVQRYLS
jgi:CMP-N,N'-diacetyllegionaminic acid synthase